MTELLHVKPNGAGVTVICFVEKKNIYSCVTDSLSCAHAKIWKQYSVSVENFLIQIYKNSLESKQITYMQSVEMKDSEEYSNLVSPKKSQ